MIGNQTYAEAIADIPLVYGMCFDDFTGEWIAPLPSGFKHLGTGGFRSAFLGPDGVVYKREWGCSYEMNQAEAKTYEVCSLSVPEGVRLAECYLYDTVLAMEYIKDDGSTPQKWENMVSWVKGMNLLDCSLLGKRRMNWHSVGGVIVLTDYSL